MVNKPVTVFFFTNRDRFTAAWLSFSSVKSYIVSLVIFDLLQVQVELDTKKGQNVEKGPTEMYRLQDNIRRKIQIN